MRFAVAVVLLGIACLPVTAQYDDEGTADYEEQDRRYLERLNRNSQKAVPNGSIEDPSEEFIALAEKLVRDKNYRSAETERYRVQSDDPRLDAGATADLLETFRDFFDGYWQGDLELAAYDKISRVFLLYSFYKYNQLLAGDFRFSPIRPQGHYGSLYDAISLHSDGDGGPEATPDAVVHEAAHQLVDQRIFGSRRSAPIWLAEGLATYFGYTRMGSDGFEPGTVGGKTVTMFRGSSGRPGDGAKTQLREFARARKTFERTHETSLVDHVLGVDSAAGFYFEQPRLHYAAAWLVVHTLLHAESERYRDGFVRYLVLEAAGEGGREALFREIGLSSDELQLALNRHVKTIKTR